LHEACPHDRFRTRTGEVDVSAGALEHGRAGSGAQEAGKGWSVVDLPAPLRRAAPPFLPAARRRRRPSTHASRLARHGDRPPQAF
jgi:hypothetical protein